MLALLRDDVLRIESAVIGLVLYGPALSCFPMLLARLIDRRRGLRFDGLWVVWMFLCLGIYPMVALLLATTTYWHASVSLWPSYFLGQACFIYLLIEPAKASRSQIVSFAIAINATISWWYVYALLFTVRLSESPSGYAVVPGGIAICQTIVCILMIREQRKTGTSPMSDAERAVFVAALVGLVCLLFFGFLPSSSTH